MPDTDVAIIGAGRTGRQVAALAAALGLKVVLFEREGRIALPRVASQALLDASRRAGPPGWDEVRAAVRAALADAAPEVSAARFEGMGVEVVQAPARFSGPDSVAAGGREWRFRRCLIDAGAAPVVPDLPGLDAVPWLTPAAFVEVGGLPGHLVVLGGEGAGLELAQAVVRLGGRATVVAPFRIAFPEDADLADGLERVLRREGVDVLASRAVSGVVGREGQIVVTLVDGTEIEGTHLLLALGEAPRVGGWT
ncbi:FAD-dependent oxidoreductase [Roseomonas sp. CCTCC AB2023176]|uniref:FAD-dependent oxidoreductase n=1 Tax=Roseomonas sp. CCTCC AB2023176 TaxID=3342640 RepID=UPI0035DB99B2